MRHVLLLAMVYLLSAGCSSYLHAPDLRRPAAARWVDEHRGAEVDVTARPGYQPDRFRGKVVGRNGYDLELHLDDGQGVTLDAPAVAAIRHRDPLGGAWRGAMIGSGVGVLPALLVGTMAGACYNECDPELQRTHFLTGVATMLAIAVALGTILGTARVDELDLDGEEELSSR